MNLILFIPFFLIIAGISFFPAVFEFLSYTEYFSPERLFSIFYDSSTRISVDVSFIYAFLSTLLTLILGLRLAYVIETKNDCIKKIIYSLLIFIWAIPNFVSIPFFRICSSWITQDPVSSAFSAFATITVARVWSDIPMMVLLCLASYKGISKSLRESVLIDGGKKREIYNEIYMRKSLPVALTYSIILFIDALRDVSIPLMITEGRPFMASGFTSMGISGYTTTLGFLLKNSITGIESESSIILNSIIVTLTVITVYFVLNRGIGKRKIHLLIIGLSEILWFGFPLGFLPFMAMLLFILFDKNIIKLAYLTISVILCATLGKISPSLILFVFIFMVDSLFVFKKMAKNFALDNFLLIIWIFWSVLLTAYMFFVAFIDTFYLPEISDIGHLSVKNFIKLFDDGFLNNILNSAIIGIGSAVIILVFAAPAAYSAFESRRIHSFSKKFISLAILLTGINTIIPLFMMFEGMKIIDSYASIILTAANKTLPLSFLLLSSSIGSLNRSMTEAARLEGGNKLKIYFSIILPLIIPTILVSVFQTFINGWSSFLAPLIFLTDPGKFPVSLRLFDYAGRKSLQYTQWGAFAAGSLISSLIIVISLIPLRKWIIKEHLR